jgi:hypothetical protein
VDAFQSEDNGETISSTLLLIKVLFEDLQLGFEIHLQFKKNTPKDVDFNGTKFFTESDFYQTRWVHLVLSPIAEEQWDQSNQKRSI